jgi:hypothetical protein
MKRANRAINQRWKRIQEQQSSLSILDAELVAAKRVLSQAQSALQRAKSLYCYYDRSGEFVREPEYHSAVSTEKNAENVVSRLKREIESLESKPAELLVSLPQSEDKALQWLFFIMMPVQFQNLCALVQASQKLLRLSCPSVPSWTNLHDWFGTHQRSANATLAQMPQNCLLSRSQQPRMAKPDIRSYVRGTGVFFPDSMSLDRMIGKPHCFSLSSCQFNLQKSRIHFKNIWRCFHAELEKMFLSHLWKCVRNGCHRTTIIRLLP